MFRLFPKYADYFDAFDHAAQNAVHSAELLADLAQHGEAPNQELVTAIIKAEHDGDEIIRTTFDRLARSNVSSIEREDIHDLVSRIDDIVDMIEAAGQRMVFYKIATVEQDFASQCAVLVKASRLTAEAVSRLRHLTDRKPTRSTTGLDDLVVVMHQAEQEGDAIHHQFLAHLFDGRLDAFEIIKWKDLCELVEEAIDLCVDVACVVHRIAGKTA